MTKEELKQEAEEYALANRSMCVEGDNANLLKEVFIDVAEPREKQIAELEQKLEQTEKDLADYQFNYPTIKELEKENAELKKQIHKMRNCFNCKHEKDACINPCSPKREKWEMK